jgi:hypothetical protein
MTDLQIEIAKFVHPKLKKDDDLDNKQQFMQTYNVAEYWHIFLKISIRNE